MAVDRSQLVRLHPYFADDKLHPDGAIEFWSGIAEAGLPASRFGKGQKMDYVHANYVAHALTIAAHVATGSVETFAEPGRLRHRRFMTRGALPLDLDTPDKQMKTAGAWNSTKFGQALHEMTSKPNVILRRTVNG